MRWEWKRRMKRSREERRGEIEKRCDVSKDERRGEWKGAKRKRAG
jgi:hypothetical protein